MRLIFVIFIALLPLRVLADERIALVIGMADYQTIVKLDNTLNDARGISDTLEGIGFNVTTVLDAGAEDLRTAVDEFAFRAETADLALIYYAGHGVEVQGENFLIPVDAAVTSNQDIQRQGVSLKQLLASVEAARKMRIVILDSCRDNPFGDLLTQEALDQTQAAAEQTRSIGSTGMAAPSPDRGTMVAFAAKDGEPALDGTGRGNSPFARALMDNLVQPDLEISLMFRKVRDQVLQSTGNQQEPHTYGSLSGTPFYIASTDEGSAVIANTNRREAWAALESDQEVQLAALADQGDTRSMLGLAYMRLNSVDPRYDPKEAAEFLQRAAGEGSAEAQFELAQLYERGLGVPQDFNRALELYLQSADQNFADALNDLGFIFFQGGLNVTRDPERALKYFERAADLRHPQAMFNWAAMIDDGNIAGRGPADAAEYLYRALRTGAEDVFNLLSSEPEMFKIETRKELQKKLSQFAFYDGGIDGDFGPGTQRGIRAAYGLTE
ncbi:MAG: caspase family protein [Pseudomonadota bacterium]